VTIVEQLKREREDFLRGFPALSEEIVAAVGGSRPTTWLVRLPLRTDERGRGPLPGGVVRGGRRGE
jgi:hypothetical protein